MTAIVTRSDVVLRPDPSRVVARLFVPGNELFAVPHSRARVVLERVLALPEATVDELAADVRERWSRRHRDLDGVLAASYEHVRHRIPDEDALSEAARRLVGAYFTQELAIEGAALFNPSIVAHPDQSGLPDGALRFVMSLRAVGEGHVSCIEFRTGTLDAGGRVHVDEPSPHAELGRTGHSTYDRELFRAGLAEAKADAETATYLTSLLADSFTVEDLDRALLQLVDSEHTRQATATERIARHLARATYRVDFPEETSISERVLRPHGPTESQGMEDARFVRMVDDDGQVVYRGTYTAFDGRHIAPQLIQTDDFRSFRVSVLAGPAAKDKGMALFPRTVDGRHLALTRSDRETTGITSSENGYWWGPPTPLIGPSRPWDLIQTGNCGSPVETETGWLVLTHGVGPMREYTLGAMLLDLDDPTKVLAELDQPIMRPDEQEREGYVPNVLYSCGALAHDDRLLLPYGFSDHAVRFAVVDLPQLLDRLDADGPR
jgi:predicted GH43/DUF377 family glycosyl hydrolase